MNINTAIKIAEKWRYKYSLQTVLKDFVLGWAYSLTNLHKPYISYENDDDFIRVSKELSTELGQLMENGYSDPLGDLFAHFGVNKEQNFYNTPKQISSLMTAVIGIDSNTLTDHMDSCSGTGSITMSNIEKLVVESTISDKNFYLEELCPVNCAASMIQISFKIAHLTTVYGTDKCPKSVYIANINVLSRKSLSQHYVLKRT